MLKKNQATELKYKKNVDKTAKQFFPPNLTPAVSQIKRATRLVQPNYYNLFDWTIQTREVI